MHLTNYDDIVNASELALIWRGNEYYPPEVIDQGAASLLANMNAGRIQMEGGYGGNRQAYDQVFDKAYQTIWQLLRLGHSDSYLVTIEQDPKVPNRIRSFKGILPKKNLSSDCYIEHEVQLGSQLSLIIACVKLNESSHREVIHLAGNFIRTFIIQSEAAEIFSKSFLIKIVEANLTSGYTIQYWSLLASLYNFMGKIYRLTGDGDNSVDIEVFYKRDVGENVKRDLETIVSHGGILKS